MCLTNTVYWRLAVSGIMAACCPQIVAAEQKVIFESEGQFAILEGQVCGYRAADPRPSRVPCPGSRYHRLTTTTRPDNAYAVFTADERLRNRTCVTSSGEA